MKAKGLRHLVSVVALACASLLTNTQTRVSADATGIESHPVVVRGVDNRNRTAFFAQLKAEGAPADLISQVEAANNRWLREHPQLDQGVDDKVSSSRYAAVKQPRDPDVRTHLQPGVRNRV